MKTEKKLWDEEIEYANLAEKKQTESTEKLDQIDNYFDQVLSTKKVETNADEIEKMIEQHLSTLDVKLDSPQVIDNSLEQSIDVAQIETNKQKLDEIVESVEQAVEKVENETEQVKTITINYEDDKKTSVVYEIKNEVEQEVIFENDANKQEHESFGLIEDEKSNSFTNFLDDEDALSFNIKIVGIGGAGCNVINKINIDFPEIKKYASLYALNTDSAALKKISVKNRYLLNKATLRGYGSGGNPDVGRQSVIADRAALIKELKGTDVLFIVAGMGKGTGSGGSPELAKIAKELGILSIAIINMPSLACEGNEVYSNAFENLKTLQTYCDSLTTISNDKIINQYNVKQISFHDAYALANNEVANIILQIINIIFNPTVMNIDFADLRSFFKKNKFFFVNNISFTQKYDKEKIIETIQTKIHESYSDISIDGADEVIVNINMDTKTPSCIVNDLRNTFSKITSNNLIKLINGISYDSDNGVDLSFMISGNVISNFEDLNKPVFSPKAEKKKRNHSFFESLDEEIASTTSEVKLDRAKSPRAKSIDATSLGENLDSLEKDFRKEYDEKTTSVDTEELFRQAQEEDEIG